MAGNLSLANKYRPKDFSDVIEQDSIKAILLNQMETNNLKHAYLFCGSAGTGKTTSARIIANMMNEGKERPIEMDCASNNGVDDMRMIIEECKTKPINSKYKIFVLDECHQLTPQAWSSLLKILEEPPSYVIFIFCTTDPQKIMGTILSRVQRFNFQRISVKGIYDRLMYVINKENSECALSGLTPINADTNAISYIARLAKGGMRDSITTLEKCLDYSRNLTLENVLKVTSGGVTEDIMVQLTNNILTKNAKSVLLQFNDIYMMGVDVALFLKLYTEFLENCTKYIITQIPDITILSDVSVNWLQQLNQEQKNIIYNLSDNILTIKSNFNSEDLKIIIESWLVRVCK